MNSSIDWQKYSDECYSYLYSLSNVDRTIVQEYQKGALMDAKRTRCRTNVGSNAPAILRLIDIIQNAPRLPEQHKVYRGVDVMPDKDGSVFNGLPISATLSFPYAVEWLLCVKKKTYSVYEVTVPKGTPCIMFGLPPGKNIPKNYFRNFWNTNKKYSDCVKFQGEILLSPNNLKINRESVKNMSSLNASETKDLGRHFVYLKNILSKKQPDSDVKRELKTILNDGDWKIKMFHGTFQRLKSFTPEGLGWIVSNDTRFLGGNFGVNSTLINEQLG